MKILWILVAYTLKRVRGLIFATAALLVLFQIIMIVVAKSLEASNSFEELSSLIPPFVRELLGPSFISIMSFKGIVCLEYVEFAIVASLVALAVSLATVPASEIESGFIDLILSRPVARHWIITRSIVTVTFSTVVLLGAMMTATWFGLEALAPKDAGWPSPDLILSFAFNLGMLMLCWGGVAMAIGSASRRRSVAGSLAGFLAVAAFLLDYVARVWKPAESVAWLSPFRYYTPFDLIMGKALPAENLVVLGSIALAGFVTAYVLFARRDISH